MPERIPEGREVRCLHAEGVEILGISKDALRMRSGHGTLHTKKTDHRACSLQEANGKNRRNIAT